MFELAYTFTDSGLHEVFFNFAFASNPQKIYEAPDFLMDIQKEENKTRSNSIQLLYYFLTGVAGVITGLFIGYKLYKNKKAA